MLNLFKGDCLEVMKDIPTASIDMILTDPPYGTTACKWDSTIDMKALFTEYKRVIKKDRPIVVFANNPFTSHLILDNIDIYKYSWIWQKNRPTGFANAKKKAIEANGRYMRIQHTNLSSPRVG